MANELTYRDDIKFSPIAGVDDNPPSKRFVYSTAASVPVSGGQTQLIGTTEEALVAVSDITSLGMAVFLNLDETNYVRVGKTGDYHQRIPPGQSSRVWLEPGQTLYAIANTAAVKLKYWIADR